jgi:hypothetical protein
MKRLLFRKHASAQNGLKNITLMTRNEDAESKTRVYKNFSYKVTVCDEQDQEPEAPQIFIKKSFDSKRSIEKFSFQVKGWFYTIQKRVLFKVEFEHTLCIKILWKVKIFSPKKSVMLT